MAGNANEIGGIRLIVGLGNPGAEYAGSRHNAGYDAIDHLLAKIPKGMTREHAHESYIWRGTYAGRPLLLQKPLTYMNLSGDAVEPLMRSEHIAPEELLVIHDDLDVPQGRIRIRCGGGDAGHNGLKSIIGRLGSEKFARIRIGAGHPASKGDVVDFVLSGYPEAEQKMMTEVLEGAADAVILMLRRGIGMAMNQFNPRNWAPVSDSASAEQDNKTVSQQKQINQHPEVQI